MAHDPLAAHRKKPLTTETKEAEPQGYVAFDAKDKVTRLQIRSAMQPTHSPGYSYLMNILYDGPYGTNFVLVFHFMSVLVRGKNLQPVIAALQLGTAEFIQEFDETLWTMPKDEKAPVITSIQFEVNPSVPKLITDDKSPAPAKSH